MATIAVSAPSSVKASTKLPLGLPPGGEFVPSQPGSPLQNANYLDYRPPSNVKSPGENGSIGHTSLRALVPLDGTPTHAISHNEAVNNLNNLLNNATPSVPSPVGGNTPSSLACIYNLVPQPSGQPAGCNPLYTTVNPSGGSGAIAIVDAYDLPTAASDLAYFSSYFGLPAANFKVIYAGGSAPYISGPQPPSSVGTGWDNEIAMDIEWAHAMAPNANIYLVEAQSSSYGDMLTAVQAAEWLVYNSGGARFPIAMVVPNLAGKPALTLISILHQASLLLPVPETTVA